MIDAYDLPPFRSQSGTGKTATFCVSVLQCLDIQVSDALSVGLCSMSVKLLLYNSSIAN